MAKRIQTWEGTRIEVGDDIFVPKGFLSLWVDPASGVVGFKVAETAANADLGALLAKSCSQPSVGRPRTPDRVRVDDPTFAAEVARALPGIPIDIAPTPEVDGILAEMEQATGIGPSPGKPPSKNVFGEAWRKPSPALSRRLDTVGDDFLAARPWDHIDPIEAVNVSAPTLGLPDGAATVVGHNGTHFGFAIVLQRSHLPTFIRLGSMAPKQRARAQLDDDLLMFDVEPGSPKQPVEAHVVRMDRGFRPAPGDAAECELVAAVAQAFVALVASLDRSRPTRVGPVTLTFPRSAPVIPLHRHAAAPPTASHPGRSRWGIISERMLRQLASWAEDAIDGWEHHLTSSSDLAHPEFFMSHAMFVVPFEGRTTAAHAFRHTFMNQLSRDDLRWLDANIDSAWTSYWSVLDTDPGRSMTLRDLFSEQVRTVIEVSASRSVVKHDLLCGRVVTVGDESYLDIVHPDALGPSEASNLRRELAAHLGLNKVKAVPIAKLRLPRVSSGLVLAWDEAVATVADARSHRQFKNTDGEDFILVTETFTLAAARGDVERLLARIDGMVAPEAGDPHWTLSKQGNAMHASWDNTTLATLRITGKRLIVETNSKQRADRVASTLRAALGPALKTSTRKEEEANSLIQESLSGPQSPKLNVVPPPEFAEAIVELKRRTYASWPDEPIPALGNVTPRAATKTAAGRKKLAALLADFERMEAKEVPAARFDFDILRRELGLKSR